jgi:hypothetical protein
MKVINHTRYSTEDLRAILIACQRHIGHVFHGLRVTFVYRRRGIWHGPDEKPQGASGVAYLGKFDPATKTRRHSRMARVRLSPDATIDNRDDACRVIEHELRHCFGTDHNHMGPALRHCTKEQDISWAAGLGLRHADPPVVPALTTEEAEAREIEASARREGEAARREAKARAKVIEFERKLKRTKTLGS